MLQILCLWWQLLSELSFFILSWSLSHTCVVQGSARYLSRLLVKELEVFSFPRFPPYFLAAVVALNSALCSSGQKDWVFYRNFIHTAQCQFCPAHRLKVVKNRWPFPFVPESSAVQNPHYFCSLSSTFRVFCLFGLVLV